MNDLASLQANTSFSSIFADALCSLKIYIFLQVELVALKAKHRGMRLKKNNRTDVFPVTATLTLTAPPEAELYDVSELEVSILKDVASGSLQPGCFTLPPAAGRSCYYLCGLSSADRSGFLYTR